MADSTPKSYHTDPTLFLYTSLTSGSSHIISATSRMQTILKANRIDFQALDVATDEKARMLWGRRAGKRKLPGLVRFGMIVGDLEEVEEWNEYGELKENVNLPDTSKAPTATPSVSATATPSKAPTKEEPAPPSKPAENTSDASTPSKPETSETSSAAPLDTKSIPEDTSAKDAPVVSSEANLAMAMRQVGFEAAKKAGDAKAKARQDELEKLKAKAVDSQKADQPELTDNLPPTGASEVKEDEKPNDNVSGAAEATENVPPTEEGKEDVVNKETEIGTEGRENVKDQTTAAAEEEMSKSAAAVTAEAAEPAKLEETAQKEPAASSEGTEETAVEKKPPHILNAKEAEEEANKAIIADEATHVHIAGSPPPYASPGMKPPKDVEENEGHLHPLNSAPKEEADPQDAESKVAAAQSKDTDPEKGDIEEDTNQDETEKLKTKDEAEGEKPEETSESAKKSEETPELVKKAEEASPAAQETESKTPKSNFEEGQDIGEESKPAVSEPVEEPPQKKQEAAKAEDQEDEAKAADKKDEGQEGEKEEDISKSKVEEAPPSAVHSETPTAPKPTENEPKPNDPAETDESSAKTPIKQTEPSSVKEAETGAETKSPAQPAAISGEKAEESVED